MTDAASRVRPYIWFRVGAVGLTVAALGILACIALRTRGAEPALTQDIPSAEGTFRIYLLGGSASFGVPYAPRADFGQLVSVLFDRELLGRPIEVVNLAGRGRTAGETLEAVRRLVEEEREPGSCAVLVYTGNNEFIDFVKVESIVDSGRRLFDVPIVPESERAQVLAAYERTLDEMLGLLDAAKIPTIVSTIAVNLRDWAPNRSVLQDPGNEARVRELLDAGRLALERGAASEAVARFSQATQLEPGFAASWMALGRALSLRQGEGDAVAAYAAHRRACEEDRNPHRAISQQQTMIRRAAAKYGRPLVDGEALIAAESEGGIPGYDTFYDNCHPNLRGYLALARGFAGALAELLQVAAPETGLTEAELALALGIDPGFQAEVYLACAKFCYGAAALTSEPEPRLARSEYYLDRAAELRPENADAFCTRGVLALLQHRPAAARGAWLRAIELEPELARKRAKHQRVRELMSANGLGDLLEEQLGDR
jgi:tetratricopeptide (TPR) repeat protein